jgi:hypothetical protein
MFFVGDKVDHTINDAAGIIQKRLDNDMYEVFFQKDVGLRNTSEKYLKLLKRRASITADSLTWDAEGTLAWIFGFWAANAKFYIDVRPEDQDLFEDRYFALFGKIPEPKVGLYNISQDVQKWAAEAEITFPTTDKLPADLAALQTACVGKIARVQLFWMLMEHGFELAETQDVSRIRAFVPETQREIFDAGVKGEN